MDPNPKRFPILSYIMSHQSPNHDIETPNPSSSSSSFSPIPPYQFDIELVNRMPNILHPDMLSSMIHAVSDVAHTRSILQTLGDRPDHETIDAALSQIASIDAALVLQMNDIGNDGEEECRVKADAQKLPYNAVLKLDEMHGAYEKLLKEAEERLEKMYVSSSYGSSVLVRQEEEEQLNENVVAILQEASVKCVDRVELSGQGLRFLPEDFGRMHGLVCLDVSNNRLEVCGIFRLGDSIFSVGFSGEMFHENLLLAF